MPNTSPQSLFIRLTTKQKRNLIRAADQSGLSLSGFVLESALKRAEAVEQGASLSSDALDWPEALKAAGEPGGRGYKGLGRALGAALAGLLKSRLPRKQAEDLLAKVQVAFSRGHPNQVWALLEGPLEAELSRIPVRKSALLLAGLAEAFERDELV